MQNQETRLTPEEFTRRLGSLCLRGGGSGLPKKAADRHVLLRSMTLGLDPARSLTEIEVNEALQRWLAAVGSRIGTDHVSLRRELVDAGYLARDSDGSAYRVGRPQGTGIIFEDGIESVRPEEALAAAEAEAERKRREHRTRSPES